MKNTPQAPGGWSGAARLPTPRDPPCRTASCQVACSTSETQRSGIQYRRPQIFTGVKFLRPITLPQEPGATRPMGTARLDNTYFQAAARLPGGAWIAVGLVLGLALSPVAARATSALTGIVGSNGSEAGVTLSNHLLTAEAAPTSSHGYHFFADSSLCLKIATTPATAGYILKQIVVDTYSDPTPGSSDAIEIWTGTGCSGFPLASIHAGFGWPQHVHVQPGRGACSRLVAVRIRKRQHRRSGLAAGLRSAQRRR